MRPGSFIVFMLACGLGVHATAGTRAVDHAAACDAVAGHALDPDRPQGVAAVADIGKARVSEAVRLCTAAAAAKGAHRRMHFQLGRALELAERYEDAARAYAIAAEAGSTSGMVGLAVLHANGLGGPQDWAAARRWFEKAAETGDPVGMSNLGSIHGGGMGVQADMNAARQWYEKAAALGFAEAMFQLGLLTQDGDIGAKDDVAAKAWFEKAAGKDHPAALFVLGEYAEQGRAGPKDEKAALDFYRRAASLGEEDAMTALERLRCPFAMNDKDGKTVGRVCFDGGNGQTTLERAP